MTRKKLVTLLARTEHQCAWIEGEPAGPKTICCGAPKRLGVSYCAAHQSIAYPNGNGKRGVAATSPTPDHVLAEAT